jgi:hypothetical protein
MPLFLSRTTPSVATLAARHGGRSISKAPCLGVSLVLKMMPGYAYRFIQEGFIQLVPERTASTTAFVRCACGPGISRSRQPFKEATRS